MEQEITGSCGTRVLLKSIPLVFDLDGTLIRTDTFHEMMLRLLYKKPWILLTLPFWFLKGRAFTKARLMKETDLSPLHLAYNEPVLAFAHEEARKGRFLVLATGTNQKMALEIAGHLRIFQDVIGSSNQINMTGLNKQKALLEQFGEGGFDYAGDSHKDLHVWKMARHAFVVHPERGVLKQVKAMRAEETIFHFPREKSRLYALFLALRPLFWICNVQASSFFFFMALCFLTSGLLIGSDLGTLYKEREGRFKKSVFAEGDLPLTTAFFLAFLLTLAPLVFFPTLLFYAPVFVLADLATRRLSQPLRWCLLSLLQILSLYFFFA